MNRNILRFGAVIGAATVSALAVAPVFAAAPLSQASAKALELNIGGNNITSGLGEVRATNDGSGQTKTGPTDPPISVLKNQGLLNIGVLVQEANAKVSSNGAGTSAACSGVAGNGGQGSLATVGDSSCITPGSPVGITLANLDLSKAVVFGPGAVTSNLTGLNSALDPILAQISKPLSDALVGALGDVGISGSLGAIESHCTAVPGRASGDANLVSTTGNNNDIPITLTAGGKSIVIASLPVNPAPNTNVPVDLSGATQAIITGVDQQLKQMFTAAGSDVNGPLYPLSQLTDAVQQDVIVQLNKGLLPLLQPLQDNVIHITLNKQVKTTDTIDVTAIDLQVLPAAQSQFGFSAVSAAIANSKCGANRRDAAAAASTPKKNPGSKPKLPAVPTVVDSGMAGHQDHTARNVLGATAALMLLAGSAGLVGYRRMLDK